MRTKLLKTVLPLLAFHFFTFPLFSQNINPKQDEVYRYNELAIISLSMEDKDFIALLAEENRRTNQYFRADLQFKNSRMNEIIEDVGIRIRGNTSRNKDKLSYKIDFKEFGGEKFHNYKKFNLKPNCNDPSQLREFLALYLYRNFNVPAARAHYCELYVNCQYMGIYLNVEQVDDEFVDRRFGEEGGNLYKCLWGATLNNPDEIFNNEIYILKTNEEENNRNILQNFAKVLKETPDNELERKLEKTFDVDNYLKQMAIESLIGHWDGYSCNTNNYYIYEDSISDKVVFIPYDLDNTFGIDWINGDWATIDVKQFRHFSDDIALNNRILGIEKYRTRYYQYILTAIKSFFNEDLLLPIAKQIQALISRAVENDSYFALDNGYSHNDFLLGIDGAWGEHVEYGIAEYIKKRASTAKEQLQGYTPLATRVLYDIMEENRPYEVFDCELATISEPVKNQTIKYYPNPIIDNFVYVNTDTSSSGLPMVYDITGRAIPIYFEKKHEGIKIVFLGDLPKGCYFIRIDDFVCKIAK